MIHENAGELTADGLRQQCGTNGTVHTAGESQQNLAVTDLLTDLTDGGVFIILHGPGAGSAADLIQEVADHLDAVLGVVHFGVILYTVEAPLGIGDGHVGTGHGMGHQLERLRHLCHVVTVAHPGDALLGKPLKNRAGGIIPGLGLAVFPGGIVLGRCDLAAQIVGHQLAAVADAEDGHAQTEDLGVDLRGVLLINAAGATGKNDADGSECPNFFHGSFVGLYLTVHIAFTYTAGD